MTDRDFADTDAVCNPAVLARRCAGAWI